MGSVPGALLTCGLIMERAILHTKFSHVPSKVVFHSLSTSSSGVEILKFSHHLGSSLPWNQHAIPLKTMPLPCSLNHCCSHGLIHSFVSSLRFHAFNYYFIVKLMSYSLAQFNMTKFWNSSSQRVG